MLKDTAAALLSQVSPIGAALFVLFAVAGGAASRQWDNPALLVAGVLAGTYCLFAIKVAAQWEKAAVLRFGRYRGLRGPGLFHIVPIIDTVSRFVDQRVRVSSISAESTLSRDTVPVNVDAILFWVVWNVYKDNPVALHLRAMNMLYEAVKEKGSMVIVPSSAVETMGLGGMLATAALGRQQ